MSEKQTENGKKSQSNETGGFKFAVTLLAALGTILYAVYIYVQTTPINPLGYVLFSILISAAPILAGGLLLYILIKGFSIEVHNDPNQKISLKDKASSIYLKTFFSFTVLFVFLLVYSVCSFFLAYLIFQCPNLKNEIISIAAPIVAIIVFLLIFIIFVYVFDLRDKILPPFLDKILLHIRGNWVGFLICFVIFALLFVFLLVTFFLPYLIFQCPNLKNGVPR